MIKNYKDEYKSIKKTAIYIAKTADDPENHILYLSFTTYGKGSHKRENKKFLDDTELDYELGVISEDEYNQSKIAHDIIEKSIANGNIY